MALIYKYSKNFANADAYFDSALVSLNNDLARGFNDPEIHISCAVANAGLGNKLPAITEGEKALDLSGNDKIYQSNIILNMAQIYTMAGAFDNAINALEYLLMNPSYFSVKLLKLDPMWEPLANVPAFQTLINKYSEN
jgi:tetratricopeptide (TPR) repeat protein